MLKNFSGSAYSVVRLGLRMILISFGLFTEATFIYQVPCVAYFREKNSCTLFHKNNIHFPPQQSGNWISWEEKFLKSKKEAFFNLEHFSATGNGEWTVRPDFYPVQPAFISVLPHCHPGFGLCRKDNRVIQAAVQ